MLRLVFMGSPTIAIPTLRALRKAGHAVLAVVTQPDKPRGRGQRVASPAVKTEAQALGLQILQPEKIRDESFIQTVRSFRPDLIVVVAYGKILPTALLTVPRYGCVNVHFSLLPRYRGASCVAQALLQGDEVSGVTVMQMDAGLDTGPLLAQQSEKIDPHDTTASLSTRLAETGAELLVKTLAVLERGELHPRAQDEVLASQAPPLRKESGKVDWSLPAQQIYNRYRAFTPWPGVFGFLQGRRILFTEMKPTVGTSAELPGTMRTDADGMLHVVCGDGRLLGVIRVKPEGKNVVSGADFMRGLKETETVFTST